MKNKIFFTLFVLLLLCYPLYMSIETWGLMPKSQEDGETVEGAIVRLISAHEADPEAHTGANESLAAHRANEVIDHPAQSVVADKPAPYLSGALLFREDGRGSAGWIINQSGANSEVSDRLMNMYFYTEATLPARADVSIPFSGYKFTFASEIAYLEFKANFSNGNTVDTWVSFGYGSLYTSNHGFGFRYKASTGHLYAFHRITTTFYDTDLGVPPLDEVHKYRVNYTSSAILFYVDDVLVATHNTNMPTGTFYPVITFGNVANATGDGSLTVRYIEYYQSSGMTDEW